MNLVASLIVHNERDRYLEPVVSSLLEFCDELRVLDDSSDDGTYEWLVGQERVAVTPNLGERFFAHEGQARQRLLEWTLEARPTHVLAIDADEFVADGRAVRAALDMDDLAPVWTLPMQEVWKVDENRLWLRRDGGWREHPAPVLWRVPVRGMRNQSWRISDKALSCGREPVAVRQLFFRRQALVSGTEILHFGWTNVADRAARYARYVEHDGGQFHASQHIQSIMWSDRRVRLSPRDWPVGLVPRKHELMARIGKGA